MSLIKWIAPVIALGLVLGFAQAIVKAEDNGKISVTVKDADGKAAADCKVKVFPAAGGKHGGHDKKAEPKAADKPAGDKPKPTAVGEGTTDADGKCTIENIPAGTYTVQAMAKGVGAGRETVTVKGGETASVTITLKKVEHKEKPAGGAAPEPK